MGLVAYADASYANDLLTRYSIGGHIVFLAGGPVFWKSKKQTFTAVSTTEAEFTNLTPAAQSLIWINQLMKEYGMEQPKPLLLYTDSDNARLNVLNPLNGARTRNIDVRYKYIIDQVRKGIINLQHLGGDQMTADGLTKPLEIQKHQRFVKQLGMVAKRIDWLKNG
ncbi:hypothetical protein QBC37DRAFT_433796 [Rhypophila decipiens]|uniref:Uncharacterized protein n=1 Tax=Rhypophila decipiens TaxID=261697 RepID=A0AAN6XUQ1_9PEZI|nr:hypothetical protein QBC37DRAFT_433796 [Rhypophila decipiens]